MPDIPPGYVVFSCLKCKFVLCSWLPALQSPQVECSCGAVIDIPERQAEEPDETGPTIRMPRSAFSPSIFVYGMNW